MSTESSTPADAGAPRPDGMSVRPVADHRSAHEPEADLSEPTLEDMADLDVFEQFVAQAELDRDVFTIAVFELQPQEAIRPELLTRLARRLREYASTAIDIAYLGQGRFAMLNRTEDIPSQWVAPIATALRAEVERWNSGELAAAPRIADLDVSDLTDRPAIITGVARGLSREVWSNAEVAVDRAREQRIPFFEYRGRDRVLAESAPARTGITAQTGRFGSDVLVDDRLIALGHRIEPVDRPEPEWFWIRLAPALCTEGDVAPFPIVLEGLIPDEQALLEIWLAGQMGPLFETTSEQLRVTIPISGEASRSRSFAQRIFPLMERHRIPPARVVVEIDSRTLVQDMFSIRSGRRDDTSKPPVRRFVEDAVAMQVEVTVSRFDGGWNAWQAIEGLPVGYIKPGADVVHHAGLGDEGAIRALVLLGSEADERAIELIVPDVDTELTAEALAQIGFTYREARAEIIDPDSFSQAAPTTFPSRLRSV